mgnify:CR=1 FL=1
MPQRHRLLVYALSTCIWCKKTLKFLEDNKIVYEHIYVDKLTGTNREEAISEIKKHNPACSFPTIIIDEHDVVVGHNESKLKELLGLWKILTLFI